MVFQSPSIGQTITVVVDEATSTATNPEPRDSWPRPLPNVTLVVWPMQLASAVAHCDGLNDTRF